MQCRIISLRFFIKETLRRSRTSYSTLQLTLWYLVLIRPYALNSFCMQTPTTREGACRHLREQNQGTSSFRALRCGRRMFLAALILASKFLQDRNFTARAWSKITGLPAQEIISNEFKFLAAIGWNLHMKEQDFMHWNCIILRCTESLQLGRGFKETWSNILDLISSGSKLDHIASVVKFQMTWPTATTCSTTPSSFGSWTADCGGSPPNPICQSHSFMQNDFATFEVDNIVKVQQSSLKELAPPPRPGLGGKLSTPQLPPLPTCPNIAAPAAGLHAPRHAKHHPEEWSEPKVEHGAGDWQKLRSEFPMDLVQTPESAASLDSSDAQVASGDAMQNRAFGVMTPVSSMDGELQQPNLRGQNSNQSESSPSALVTPTAVPRAESACSTMSNETNSRLTLAASHGSMGGAERPSTTADEWLNMLVLAADVVDSSPQMNDSGPQNTSRLVCASNVLAKSEDSGFKLSCPAAARSTLHCPSIVQSSNGLAQSVRANLAQQPRVKPTEVLSGPGDAKSRVSECHCQVYHDPSNCSRSSAQEPPPEGVGDIQKSAIGCKRPALHSCDRREAKSRCVSSFKLSAAEVSSVAYPESIII